PGCWGYSREWLWETWVDRGVVKVARKGSCRRGGKLVNSEQYFECRGDRGDKAMLKVSPWKGVIRFGKQEKLNPCYIGSFEIIAKVGTVVYQIKLPEQLSRVHSTFHILNLKKRMADEALAIPLDKIQADDKLYFIEEPVEIMNSEVKRLKQSCISIMKVHCNCKRAPEFTWEHEDQMQKKYPHLFTNYAPVAETTS
nr:putative reverse transcriptase domain-containing protein [Tanacetum cinerariifolium]